MILELHQIHLPLGRFPLEVSTVIDGGTTGISGPSGSGKTSLLETIAGLRRPASGRLTLDGITLFDSGTGHFTPPRLRRIGYVPQDQALFPHWTARENLLAGSRLTRTPPDPQRLATLTNLLELDPLLPRGTGSLSGGEKARLALGRALLSQPVLLLLDEPLTHLDDRLRDRTLGYLKTAAAEFRLPMLMVSHSAHELGFLCGRILTLQEGRLLDSKA